MMRDLLLGNRLLSSWIQQSTIERLVNQHIAGTAGHGLRLWPLLVLAIWVQRFGIDR